MSKAPELTAEERARIEAVGLDYRAGVLPIRAIAERHKVSVGVIPKWANRFGWERDLSKKIQAKADAAVNRAVVNAQMNTFTRVSEQATIDANTKAIVEVRLSQRTDIRTGRDLVAKLFGELKDVTDRPDLIEDLVQALASTEVSDDDEDAAKKRAKRITTLRELLDRLVSLPGRVAAVKGLSEALRHLIGLEREAWGIDAKEKDPSDLDDLADDELDRRIEARFAKLNAASAPQ